MRKIGIFLIVLIFLLCSCDSSAQESNLSTDYPTHLDGSHIGLYNRSGEDVYYLFYDSSESSPETFLAISKGGFKLYETIEGHDYILDVWLSDEKYTIDITESYVKEKVKHGSCETITASNDYIPIFIESNGSIEKKSN